MRRQHCSSKLKTLVLLLMIIVVGGMVWPTAVRGQAIPPPRVDAPDLGGLETEFGGRFAGETTGAIVNEVVKWVFALSGVGVLFYLIYGGYHLMVSQGNEQAVAEARGKITNAIVGFIVVFVAYWIVQAMGVILGLEGLDIWPF